MKEEQYFYKSLYRGIIVRYTKGITNSMSSLSTEDKRQIAILFRKLKFVYLKILSYEKEPNKNLVRKCMFVFINKIKAKSITSKSYARQNR